MIDVSLRHHHPSSAGACPCRAHQVIAGHAISISAKHCVIRFLSVSLSAAVLLALHIYSATDVQ